MNLRSWVISKAFYDGTGGVGKSKLMETFPHELGPDVFYDHLPNLRKPYGRHPDTGDVLLVTEVDRYTSTIVTPGVMSHSDRITPAQDTVPPVCVTEAIVYDIDVATAIHQHNQHLVLAFETVDGSEPPLEGWGKDDPFTEARWAQLRNGLVALGADPDVLDTWRGNHPDGTPAEFYNALDNYIKKQAK